MKENAIIEKIRTIAGEVKIAMMTTLNENNRMRSRPMQVMQVDDDAAMWFFTDEFAGKTDALRTDNPVVLTFADRENDLYLSLSGRTYLVKDEQKIASIWNPVLNTWFPGKEKTSLLMIKFVPEQAEYWSKAKSIWEKVFYAGKAIAAGDSYKDGKHDTVQLN